MKRIASWVNDRTATPTFTDLATIMMMTTQSLNPADSMEVFSPETCSWSVSISMAVGRAGHACCIHNDVLWVMGGFGNARRKEDERQALRSVEVGVTVGVLSTASLNSRRYSRYTTGSTIYKQIPDIRHQKRSMARRTTVALRQMSRRQRQPGWPAAPGGRGRVDDAGGTHRHSHDHHLGS